MPRPCKLNRHLLLMARHALTQRRCRRQDLDASGENSSLDRFSSALTNPIGPRTRPQSTPTHIKSPSGSGFPNTDRLHLGHKAPSQSSKPSSSQIEHYLFNSEAFAYAFDLL